MVSPSQPASDSDHSTADPSPVYDNNGQYSRTGILRYEKIFGDGYISTGGPETTDDLCSRLDEALRPGVRVLDVGSGIGGAAFYLAKNAGAVVTGIDLAPEMIAIALERAGEEKVPLPVSFLIGDILETEFAEPFDIIWSRDALMHIHDKPRLFKRLHDLLAPGGQLVVTDYARGTGEGSPEFQAYVRSTGYHLVDPLTYGKLLEGAGFVDVVVEDATKKFMEIMKREGERLASNREDFVGMFSETDLNYLVERWAMKDGFCRAGDMKWGIYQARRRP
ncbi:MAG: methyltransferase domain-containing protein [Isosphaeraceae bacterium]